MVLVGTKAMKNTPENVLSFAYADEPEVVVVDRSTLERFASCPAQARFIETGAVLNESGLAAAGQAVHDSFGAAIAYYIDAYPDAGPNDIAEEALLTLRSSRPDIQPEALNAGRYSVRAWAWLMSNTSARNILRFDGGEGDRCGQLSADVVVGDLTLRVTSEVDLLLATESPEVVREIDYKSGWKKYGIEDIASSFQFQLHAWLILQNYPDVQAVQVKVWNCRTNDLSYGVMFDRKRLNEWDTRIRSTAGEYARYRSVLPQNAPTWPALEKCSQCFAAALCPASGHVADVSADPGGFVDAMVALQARLDAMEKLAAAQVEATGQDILSPSGAAFGVNKPTKKQKPRKALYSVKTTEESDG